MSLLFRQVASALFLLIGLIISLSWYEWKDSSFWMLILGGFLSILGIIGVVTTIAKAEEEIEAVEESEVKSEDVAKEAVDTKVSDSDTKDVTNIYISDSVVYRSNIGEKDKEEAVEAKAEESLEE